MEPSDEVLRGLIAAAPDALLAVDGEGTIVYANAQASLLFGWPAGTLEGESVDALVPVRFARGHPRLRAGYMAHAVRRPMGAGLDLWARRRDGTEFPAEISLSAITTPDGMLVAAAVRDITDRRQLEAERREQALAAQREQSHRLEALGQLAGGIAHDFNNLLGVILNYASLLARDAESDDVRADLAEISAAAERGAGLTRQLLTFARRDAGRRESVEVNTVVRDVTTMLRRTLGELVELELLLHPQPLHVLADRHQLEQIVLNLAINARDAMPDGGTLVITTRPGPEPPQPGSLGTVELSVVDSGTGMSPDVVERAVEPFFTTKPPGQGTGLGLATVYGIAGQHGGELALESALGAGTTVTVRLPAAQAPTALLPEAGGAEQAGRGERVLLVEDESALRVGTARLLERHGYAVTTAVDGEEAWSMLTASQDYDVVLTDIVMPRLKGSQLARRLRDTGSEIPVVFMSGYDSGDTSAIPGPVLVKPVEERELLATLRSVLDPEIS